MEKIVEQGMLYDFYGELLTEHQRKIYEDVVLNDMSLSEIAEEQGISRQGVHDLVRRCDRMLQSYEERLHLIARFQKVKHTVEKIEQIAKKHNLKVIYDAAHTFGAEYKGKSAAAYGDASIYSFHATKVFNTIEGGAVAFGEPWMGHRLNCLKNFGIVDQEHVVWVGGNALSLIHI